MLLAATHEAGSDGAPTNALPALLSDDDRLGVRDPAVVGDLQRHAGAHAHGVHDWLVDQRNEGRSVLGYGAASRAVALLCRARIDRELLPAIIDTSTAKYGRRMPGTDIPIVDPAMITTYPPDAVLLFVPDLLAEVREAFPEVEASGAVWVDAESLRP